MHVPTLHTYLISYFHLSRILFCSVSLMKAEMGNNKVDYKQAHNKYRWITSIRSACLSNSFYMNPIQFLCQLVGNFFQWYSSRFPFTSSLATLEALCRKLESCILTQSTAFASHCSLSPLLLLLLIFPTLLKQTTGKPHYTIHRNNWLN